MDALVNSRLMFSPAIIVVLWLAVLLGNHFHIVRPLEPEERRGFSIILTATLTLLFLIMGFSFSLAASRYEDRKTFEEAEANAIGTEYTRADLLPPADAARVRLLLTTYLDQRIQFYRTRNANQLQEIRAATSRQQVEMWSSVKAPAEAQPTPLNALTISGMNDVLNSQGDTHAAWLNRIPTAAWVLMTIIAICSNVLIGFGARPEKARHLMFFVLPLIIAIAFYLIADIDSPRNGIIRVNPENLISLSTSLAGK